MDEPDDPYLAEIPTDPEFGRPLAVNETEQWVIIVLTVFGAVCLFFAFYLATMPPEKGSAPDNPFTRIGAAIVGCVFGLFSLGAGLKDIILGPRRTVMYERGLISRRGRGVARRAAYHTLDMAYSHRRGGTDPAMVLYFPNGGSLRFGTNLPDDVRPRRHLCNGEQFEEARAAVVMAIATRMLDQVADGKVVHWCGNAQFSPQGVLVSGQLVPWSQAGERVDETNGRYTLVRGGRGEPLTTLSMINRNFLPGWKALRLMRSAQRSQ